MKFTKEQMAERRTGIGASEIAAVVGKSPWMSPLDLYRAKTEESYDVASTPAMDWGNRLEEPIAQWYADTTETIVRPGAFTRHPKASFAFATPDRFVFTSPKQKNPEWSLQIKTSQWRSAAEWGEEGTDEIPAHINLQVQWEMECKGLERADIPVLLSGQEARIYTVHRDAELAGVLLEAAGKFWVDHVVPRRPPAMDAASAEWGRYLLTRHPKPTSQIVIAAPPEAERWAKQLQQARSMISAGELLEQESANHLTSMIGDAYGMIAGWGKAIWYWNGGKPSTDWEAIGKAAGMTAAEAKKTFQKTGNPFRVFKPTFAAEEAKS